MHNIKDYSKNTQFTPENARLNQIKSEEARRENVLRKRTMKEDLTILLNLAIAEGRAVDADELKNLAEANGKNISVQTAIDVAMVQRAMLGDVQAAQYIRDTVGQKPSDKVELDQSLTVEAWAKSKKVKL